MAAGEVDQGSTITEVVNVEEAEAAAVGAAAAEEVGANTKRDQRRVFNTIAPSTYIYIYIQSRNSKQESAQYL